jgi:hypothetical protein
MTTKQELEKARQYWTKVGSLHLANVGGACFDYFSAPQKINPELPDYAWFLSDGEEAVIAVSNRLPREYQNFWAFHELIEATQESGEGKCLRTLKRELALVPEIMKADYLYRRAEFFRNLIEFGRKKKLPKEGIKEFEGSLNHLESLLGK